MMSNDLVMLRVVIVSGRKPERETFKRAASQLPLPMEVIEFDPGAEPAGICERLVRARPDMVVVDVRMDADARAAIMASVGAMADRPLLVLFGCTRHKVAEALAAGLAADGLTTAPISKTRALALLHGCLRARTGSRALIVDQSSEVRSVVAKVLAASRFRLSVQEAGNAAAAIDLVLRQGLDLVFLDCDLPGRDGFSTLAELKRIRPDIEVVMMAAAADPALRKRAEEAGAHDLLVKPFYTRDIDAVLNRLFGLTEWAAA